MLYCFIKEDIDKLDKRNPLFLQFEYAKKLGKCCICDLQKALIMDLHNQKIELANEKIFLRTTYDNLVQGVSVLEKSGCNLVENKRDIDAIEAWHRLGLSSREIFEIDFWQFLESDMDGEIEAFLKKCDNIFIKSEKKGFCAVVCAGKILKKDVELVEFLREKCKLYGDKLLLTDFLEIKTDSLGKRESRYIVLNGEIMNSSRKIHSLKHCVPKSHLEKAKEIVNQIRQIENYPQNYVLDIGEFVKNGQISIDIVELNPISCSMCYVNNSVFVEKLSEIEFVKKKFMIGNEYCYDALRNSECYFEMRKSNRCYSYDTEEFYEFL